MKDLVEKLLELGGSKVMLPDSVPEKIRDLGHVYDSSEVLIPKNGTSKYFKDHEHEVRVMWGFVLEKDIWKMHSWLLKIDSGEIIDNKFYDVYYRFVKEK